MATETMATIIALTKKLRVLYVEDEESVRTSMYDILCIFFDTIHIAENGIEGLEKLQQHTVDMVITDIQMPRMNGLEMIENIRRDNPNLPIVITTAFSDQDYFIRSIDLKVDKYLIKPIEQSHAKEVFYAIAKMLDDRRKAKELEVSRIQKQINRIAEHIVAQITDSYQSPCIVYTEQKVRYINDVFCSLFDAEDLERFLLGDIPLATLFDQRPGYLCVLEEFDERDPLHNRISISKRHGRKIYRVSRKTIYIDENDTPSLIYFFNDITLEEYQKIKIHSYSEMLEELLITERYRRSAKPSAAVPVQKRETAPPQAAGPAGTGQKLTINDDENRLLRRSHLHKTAAGEYVAELDDEVLKELQELDELDRDFCDSIALLQEESNPDGIRQMSSQLERYAHEISLLFEFEDLAYAIRSLASLLASVDESRLNATTVNKVVTFLSGIQSDLSDWRRILFIEQSTLDIHYLDSSLFSACLQIELALSAEHSEMENEDDDLILF